MEGEYSNGEDPEVEDVGEDIEVEATARNEEARETPRSSLYSCLIIPSPVCDRDSDLP